MECTDEQTEKLIAGLVGLGFDESEERARLSPRKRRPKFKEWTYDELVGLPDTHWLAGDEERPVLIANGLWLNYGLFKGGKTYRSMELAFCIAFGLEFHGLPVTQGNVAYVVAEGGTKRHLKRLLALCEKYNLDPEVLNSGRFNLITSPVNLAEASGVDELLNELRHHPYVAVWLDTWARMLSASGGHDTDPDTVGPAIQGCDQIREALDCTVTIVAHVGWSRDAQDRPKGLVDLPGAIDGATLCKKVGEGANAVFHFTSKYQRHAADGFEQCATLQEFGSDRAFVSAPLQKQKVKTLKPDLQQCLSIVRELGDLVTVDQWRDAVKDGGRTPKGVCDGATRSTTGWCGLGRSEKSAGCSDQQ
jgi:AAA domain